MENKKNDKNKTKTDKDPQIEGLHTKVEDPFEKLMRLRKQLEKEMR